MGLYAILGCICFVVLSVVMGYLLLILRDLAIQVRNLSQKTDQLVTKVSDIANQVNSITTEVGVRTTGIVRMVDESASGAIRILEVLAPVFVVYGAFLKVKKMSAARKR